MSIYAGAGQWTSGTRSGIFRREGAGGWEQLTNGLPATTQVQAITLHPTNPDIVYIGTQDGPYRSTDGGDRWERLGFPERDAVVWSVAIHPTRPNVIYAGLAPVALYRSEDGGDTWRKLTQARSPAHCEKTGFDTRTIRI